MRGPAGALLALSGALSVALSIALPAAAGAADVESGRQIAAQHCTRCHVVGDLNRHGGIGSTPSFGLLAGFDDWRERFSMFYALRPHPVFVRVPGLPPPTDLPSHVATFEITPEQVEDLVAFIEAMRAGAE